VHSRGTAYCGDASVVWCSVFALSCSTVQYGAAWCVVVWCSVLQSLACVEMQVLCGGVRCCVVLCGCSMVQHAVLQCVAVSGICGLDAPCIMQCLAECCSVLHVLQCVAVCCSCALHYAVSCRVLQSLTRIDMQGSAKCPSTSSLCIHSCVAVCCSVLQLLTCVDMQGKCGGDVS